MPTYQEIKETFRNNASWLLKHDAITGHYIAEGPLGILMLKYDLTDEEKQEIIDRLGMAVAFETTGEIKPQGNKTSAGLNGPAGDIALP